MSLPFNRSSVERLPKLAAHASPSNVALFAYNLICMSVSLISHYYYLCMVGCQCDIQLWEGEGGMDAVPGVDPAIVSTVPLGFLTVTK